MNHIRFYIFGIPDGFDIYQEKPDAEIKNYYQCFYDESIKETTRLAIHRKADGDVSYTFLKYHLYSCGNRANAFLGLSVVFHHAYYADVSSLYNLLEHAYHNLLQREVLLTATANGMSAKFVPQRFEEVSPEIKRIESFIIGTLNTVDYAAEIHPIDNSFRTGKQNAILKIPFQVYGDDAKEKEANSMIAGKLKEYAWLSLSPEYIRKEKPLASAGKASAAPMEWDEELDPMTKAQYIRNFEIYQGEVLAAFEKLVNRTDENLTANAKHLDGIVKNILLTLQEYRRKQNELQDLLEKYSGLAEKLDTLMEKLYEKPQGKRSQEYITTDHPNEQEEEPDREQKGGKWKRYLIGAGAIIAAAFIGISFLYPYLHPDNGKDTDPVGRNDSTVVENGNKENPAKVKKPAITTVPIETLVESFNTALQENRFEDAAKYYQQVVKQDSTGPHPRNFDRAMDEKFKNLIDAKQFETANELLCQCLENKDLYKYPDEKYRNNLISTFKTYIQNHKSKPDEKEELIAQIESAKDGNYAYKGIDKDLKNIRSLAIPEETIQKEYKLAVFIEDSKKASSTHTSSDTIEICINKQYKIKNLNWVEGASFVRPKCISNKKCYPNPKKEKHTVQVKFTQKEDIGKTFKIPYKKGDKTLFEITIKVVQSQSERKPGRIQ